MRFYEIPKKFWKIFISLLGDEVGFSLFFRKNFCHGIDPPIDIGKIPLYKGGYGGGGGYARELPT
jgi:hypothetical protein